MKFNHILFTALALGALSSCKNDALVDDTPATIPAAGFNEKGEGYVKVAINTNIGLGTRAIGAAGDEYGEFNDGDKNEYTVENAILVLFDDLGQTDETKFKMVGAYDLSSGDWKNPTDVTDIQVTTNREFIKKIDNGGVSGKLHAYVIINRHNFFALDNNKTLTFMPQCPDPGCTNVVLNGKTMAEFAALSFREEGRRYDANSFLMTNMPFVDVAGGASNPGTSAKVKNLYPLDGAIWPTESEAMDPANPAAEINVERVLAKVETTLKEGIQSTVRGGYKFQFLGWFVDNTNPNTYIGRHTLDVNAAEGHKLDYLAYKNTNPGADTYRMVSQYPVST